MAKKLKSAVELAMEKLARQEGAPARLSDEQKKEIEAIRQEYTAKLAERDILCTAERQAAAGDPETLERVETEHRRQREILAGHREERIREVKERGKS